MISYINKLISILVLISFSFFLLVPKSGVIVFFILVLSILGLFLTRDSKVLLSSSDKYFLLTITAFFLLSLLNVIYHNGSLRDIDVDSRFIIVIPIFLYLRKINLRSETIVYSVVTASIIYGLLAINIDLSADFVKNPFSKNTGMVSLYAGIFSISSLFFIHKKNKVLKNLFISLGVFSGLYATLIAGGRGAWLGSLVILLTYFFINPLNLSKKIRSIIALGFLGVSIIFSTSSNSVVMYKIETGFNDFINFFQKNVVSGSVGTRLEMYKAASILIQEKPILGYGIDQFKTEKQKLIDEGRISKEIQRYRHPHNEFISTTFEKGLVGLISLLALLLFPVIKSFKILIKASKFDSSENVPAIFLYVVSLEYLIYAFTNAIFAHQNMALFFALSMVISLGICSKNTTTQKT